MRWPVSDVTHRFGEEAAPNARVWKVYRDAVNEVDDDMLDGWTDTLNILLTFVSSSYRQTIPSELASRPVCLARSKQPSSSSREFLSREPSAH